MISFTTLAMLVAAFWTIVAGIRRKFGQMLAGLAAGFVIIAASTQATITGGGGAVNRLLTYLFTLFG